MLKQLAFSMLAALTLSATPAFAADPVFPTNSRIGMTPPPGFAASTRFPGFENPTDKAVILLSDLPAEAFPEIEKGFTDEVLKSRGMTVKSREAITVKDGKGFVVTGPNEGSNPKRYDTLMVATVGGLTTIVSVQMVEAAQAKLTDKIIKDALMTVAVRKDVPEAERLSVLPYKLSNLAKFRLIRAGQDGVAILTDGPNDAVEAVQQPFMLIGVTPGEAPKPEERDAFAKRLFGTAPGIKEVKITRAEPLRMGQAQGYEIVADAKDAKSGTDVTTVQWIRFGQTAHIQMFAIVRRPAWNDVFPRLRQIRDGVEMR